MESKPTEISSSKMFEGYNKRYKYFSPTLGCSKTLYIYFLPSPSSHKFPVLYWLSGLSCTDENFIIKSGAQRAALAEGVALVAPDTSPRGLNVEGAADSWDFGSVSAFAPIVNPINCPWVQKAFTNYLGNEKAAWEEYDATHLIWRFHNIYATILIDQDDKFLHNLLLAHKFEEKLFASRNHHSAHKKFQIGIRPFLDREIAQPLSTQCLQGLPKMHEWITF